MSYDEKQLATRSPFEHLTCLWRLRWGAGIGGIKGAAHASFCFDGAEKESVQSAPLVKFFHCVSFLNQTPISSCIFSLPSTPYSHSSPLTAPPSTALFSPALFSAFLFHSKSRHSLLHFLSYRLQIRNALIHLKNPFFK